MLNFNGLWLKYEPSFRTISWKDRQDTTGYLIILHRNGGLSMYDYSKSLRRVSGDYDSELEGFAKDYLELLANLLQTLYK